MFTNVRQQILKCAAPRRVNLANHDELTGSLLCQFQPQRCLSGEKKFWFRKKSSQQSTDLVVTPAKDLLVREFPGFFHEGKFQSRMAYIDFIDQALDKLEELGLEKDLEAYKELLRVFPPGRYSAASSWDIGMFHAPQQLCAIRVLHKMELNNLRPDLDFERIIIAAFGKTSQVWLKIARANFWSMKGRNVDLHPIPEKLPEKTHELAQVALVRMLNDHKTLISLVNTSSLPDSVDKTWIAYTQSPTQMSIIERLDEKSILFIEDCGYTYVGEKYMTYYALKVYDDEATLKRRRQVKEPDFNYNTLKMQFFGKPIREKLKDPEEAHHVGDGYVLGLCITGTSSHDSLLSWLKILQNRNPKLKDLSVVFKLERPTWSMIDPVTERDKEKQNASN